MTDIAQILGVDKNKDPPMAPAAPPPSAPPGYQPTKAVKMQATLPREVMHLLGSHDANTVELPMRVPAFPIQRQAPGTAAAAPTDADADQNAGKVVKVGNKFISISKPARKWAWAPFSSSSRTDGALFYHWVRANVEYPDYPYARFDIHLDPMTYNDDEYKTYLQSDTWSKSQTDFLLELARRFELRWPIIHDRWMEAFGIDCCQKVEDLQHRYYSVAAKLNAARISQEATKEVQNLVAVAAANAPVPGNPESKAIAEALLMETAAARALASSELEHQPLVQSLGSGTTNKPFDVEYERERRAHMEALWNRSKQDELEELEIRRELKQVEAQLRKLKKSGRHILAASKGKPTVPPASSASSSANPSRPQTPAPIAPMDAAELDQAFASTAPTPMPQTPYLQSGRLVHPAVGGPAGLNKILLNRMDEMLDELKIPIKPLPTKRVCDLYDQVRRDALTLLVLQKQIIQKEGLVQSKRLKLAKMGGDVRIVDEETLLGISPPPSANNASAAARAKKASAPKSLPKAASATSTTTVSKPKAPRPTTTPVVASSKDPSKKPDNATSSKVAFKDSSSQVKSASKKAVKRKRKAEPSTKSPVPAPLAAAAAPISSLAAAAVPSPLAMAPKPDEGGKQAKKRPKKST